MVRALLKLSAAPTPADTADALAVALCHLHHAASLIPGGQVPGQKGTGLAAGTEADWLARAAPTSPWRGP
jgi:hypothetical protein